MAFTDKHQNTCTEALAQVPFQTEKSLPGWQRIDLGPEGHAFHFQGQPRKTFCKDHEKEIRKKN